MLAFFKSWQRKVGLAILIISVARLVFSWRLTTWCFETVNGYETRQLWVFRPDWHVEIPLTLIAACLILWKPRKRVSSPPQS